MFANRKIAPIFRQSNRQMIDTLPELWHTNKVAAGWSSLAARRAHNPKVVGSNPTPATIIREDPLSQGVFLFW